MSDPPQGRSSGPGLGVDCIVGDNLVSSESLGSGEEETRWSVAGSSVALPWGRGALFSVCHPPSHTYN